MKHRNAPLTDSDYQCYGIGKRYLQFKLDDYKRTSQKQEQVLNKIIQYAENLGEYYNRGQGLLLLGNIDTGKTQLASYIIKHALDLAGGRSRLLTEKDLLADIARADNFINGISEQEIINKFVDYYFLAIDDVGIKPLSERERARLYAVINSRYTQGRPTIISSNLDPLNLNKHFGKRIYSRLTSRTASDILIFDWQPFHTPEVTA